MLDNSNVAPGKNKTLRCAIYTRKSHEEGLEQGVQLVGCATGIGGTLYREPADAGLDGSADGGFSGGNMERPGLRRLLADIDAGKIDVIVVYKVDRLSRSLLDFMKMIDLFNEKGVSFVSVTQHFSTTDPTGRMFLGILITFAQYEREVIAERIRDKVAAAKRRGKYCGGVPILGYDVDRDNKKLLVNPDEARTVQYIFRRFIQIGSAKKLGQELNEQGYRTKAWTTKKGKVREGSEWNTAHIYRLLNNRIYIGEIAHKDRSYPGDHEGIIDRATWDKVKAILEDNKPVKVSMARTKMVAPLKGVIRCGHCGCAMGPTYARKNGRHYTYYICQKDSKRTLSRCPLKRIPAGDIEQAKQERLFKQKAQLEMELSQAREQALELMKPGSDQPGKAEMLTTVNRQAVELSKQLTHVSERCKAYQGNSITEVDVSEAFQNVEGFWEDLFPIERNRLIRLLVDRVEIRETGIDMELATRGLTTLIAELAGLACEVTERRASR
jgi:site-specific DNA recombinase